MLIAVETIQNASIGAAEPVLASTGDSDHWGAQSVEAPDDFTQDIAVLCLGSLLVQAIQVQGLAAPTFHLQSGELPDRQFDGVRLLTGALGKGRRLAETGVAQQDQNLVVEESLERSFVYSVFLGILVSSPDEAGNDGHGQVRILAEMERPL